MRREPEVVEVYSRSLLQVVKASGRVQEYVDESIALRGVYLGVPAFQVFLEAPSIRDQDKALLVERVFGRGKLLPLLFNFLRLLIRKKRMLLLPDILEDFRIKAEEQLGLVVGKVVTAIPLDAGRQARLKQMLESVTGLRFVFDYKVDPGVLGGVLVTYQDVMIDGTLRGRLADASSRIRALL
jgi:F-type H+-transporting ATPase subunit delta